MKHQLQKPTIWHRFPVIAMMLFELLMLLSPQAQPQSTCSDFFLTWAMTSSEASTGLVRRRPSPFIHQGHPRAIPSEAGGSCGLSCAINSLQIFRTMAGLEPLDDPYLAAENAHTALPFTRRGSVNNGEIQQIFTHLAPMFLPGQTVSVTGLRSVIASDDSLKTVKAIRDFSNDDLVPTLGQVKIISAHMIDVHNGVHHGQHVFVVSRILPEASRIWLIDSNQPENTVRFLLREDSFTHRRTGARAKLIAMDPLGREARVYKEQLAPEGQLELLVDTVLDLTPTPR